ncbi:MAG: prepilin-type N-terminal cleavage/methylation domain-containing protein [Planctomycetota bacterium]
MEYRKNCAGFTLVEILVVISIIAVLAVMIIPGLVKSRYLAKKAATRTEIANMETALGLYAADYGVYPDDDEDDSTKKLVEALKGDPNPPEGGQPRKTYYPFKKSRLNDGEYYSEFDKPFKYRENASETEKDENEMKNLDTFDIWTDDAKGNEKGINNWD